MSFMHAVIAQALYLARARIRARISTTAVFQALRWWPLQSC